MTYTDGISGVLARIGQIQSTFASLPETTQPSDFDSLLALISALPIEGGPATSAPGAEAVGWPLEEGRPVPPQSSMASNGSPAVYESSVVNDGPASAPGTSPATPGQLGQEVVADARKYLGAPYLWGGTNPSTGVDCSGLVQDVFADLGVKLPRTSQEQALVGVAVPSLADAQPGDLVFFPGADGTVSAPGHVGIYIGNGQMIDAPYQGADVRVDPVGDPTAIRRIDGTAAAAAGGDMGIGATAPVSTAITASPAMYSSDFASAAASSGVPQALLEAVASTESSYQTGAVSNAGAEGLMQLEPSTAASLGVNPFDPTQAINGAASLLAAYYKQFGSWPLALAAYNAGPSAVTSSGGVPPIPQTEAYVKTVMDRAGMEPA
jgi:cell wall-associated NlpC family hydrolase